MSQFEVKQEAVSSICVFIRMLAVLLLYCPLKMALYILNEWVFLRAYYFRGFVLVWSSFGHPRVIGLYICLAYWTSDKHSKPWTIFSQLFLDKYLLPFWKSSDVIIRHDSALIGVLRCRLKYMQTFNKKKIKNLKHTITKTNETTWL